MKTMLKPDITKGLNGVTGSFNQHKTKCQSDDRYFHFSSLT